MQALPSQLEVLTTGEMAAADRAAVASGVPSYELMERAGRAVFEVCRACVVGVGGTRVVALCGPGNNGGDGFVVARLLREAGYGVALAAAVPVEALRGDALRAAQAWTGPVETLGAIELAGADLVVDALFGAGLARPLDGEATRLVERLNAADRPVVSIDLPSGVSGDTGQFVAAVRATTTVTFFRLKPAHLLLPGRERCGEIVLSDIGIPPNVLEEIAPRTLFNGPRLWRREYPVPGAEGHKYSRGHALVVSGAMPTTGAARLAARGALRIGAGLVTVASPADAMPAHAAQLTSIMLRGSDGPAALSEILDDTRKNAVVMGPGLGVGPETRILVETALEAGS